MRYLMFADTAHGEYTQIFHAGDNDTAIRRMDTWLRGQYICSSDVYSVAGIWEKDPKFYTANCLADLDDER